MQQDSFCAISGSAVNVGDTRIYHINASGKARQLSKDHTLLQGLIDEGKTHKGMNYSSAYDALEHYLCADFASTDFAISRQDFCLKAGEQVLLCTDGVHETLGDLALWNAFKLDLSPASQCVIWRKEIMKRGAPDNFSMILVRCDF